jgi:hypothetical protein
VPQRTYIGKVHFKRANPGVPTSFELTWYCEGMRYRRDDIVLLPLPQPEQVPAAPQVPAPPGV